METERAPRPETPAGPLSAVAGMLACPVCAPAMDAPLEVAGKVLLCPRGHSFDIARQGYVSLLSGATKMGGDSADMLAARAAFLGAGHFAPITAALSGLTVTSGLVLELGAGTGHYLGAVLDSAPAAAGIALDVSKAAARRAARAHARAASVVADAWQRLPVRDGACAQVLSVFAPRNPAEVYRVLARPGQGAEAAAQFIVVTPGPRHLQELVGPLGMVGVDPDKPRRLGDALSGLFTRVHREPVEFTMALRHPDVAAVAGMGPSAHHGGDGRAQLIAQLPDPVSVTASVVVSVYEPAGPALA